MGITRRWNSIFGFLFGLFLSWIFFGGIDKNEIEKEYYGEGIQLAENWERNILEQKRGEENGGGHNQQQQPKLNRPRFASSELGIQQKLLIFILSRTSTSNIISPLYQFLSQQNNNILPIKVFIFTTTDQQQLINSNNDLPLNAQTIIVRRSDPVSLLNSIANISLLTHANWYLILPDTTFVNIYELEKIINSILWNSPIAFGWNINEINNNNNEELNNNNENEGHCILEAGLLLSSTAMNLIIQGRHLCNGLSLTSFSSSGHGEDYSLEICIRLASNINCKSTFEGFKHNWWRISSKEQESLSPSIHDQIEHLSQFSLFNNSLTISPLLSELDISALIKHFLNVKFTKIEEEIKLLEEKTLKYYSIEETGWPIGVNNLIKPINRFQVPVWELVTSEWKRFSNDPEENWANLNEDERIEWKQVYEEAKMSSKCSKFETTFIEGYKRFNPNRGIDYLIDLNCNNNNILERIQINRPIHSTKLLEKVPYVKEDREIALLVPVETPAQIYGLHPFLRKILSICMSGIIENSSNQIRLLIAVRNIEALPIRLLSENLAEMRKRCHLMESSLLLLKPDPNYQIAIELAALDEAVDRFGQQTLFLLLSPFTDFQPDFLDRVRLNSIQNFQVFFPIPFTEFNQIVTGLTPKELQTFIIHKDRGRFASDIDYWPIAGLFGSDFISSRIQHPNAQTIYSLFLNQTNIHIFRAIEPSLKIRSHLRDCSSSSSSLTKFFSIEQKKNCERRRKLSLGTRAQLAKLFLFTIAPSNNNEFQKPK